MTNREKLIELIGNTHYGKENGSLVSENLQLGFIEKIADHLIEGGVTMQKTGRWEVSSGTNHTNAVCSACKEDYYYFNKGQYHIDHSNYCPNCGALMSLLPKRNDEIV